MGQKSRPSIAGLCSASHAEAPGQLSHPCQGLPNTLIANDTHFHVESQGRTVFLEAACSTFPGGNPGSQHGQKLDFFQASRAHPHHPLLLPDGGNAPL